mmetsp:Transcript_75493/g.221346  ORF Transcript_75493/g.221346 Transcript_75493/m.221346 type:complete len:222 (-) Transcript_75493:224-889(-)
MGRRGKALPFELRSSPHSASKGSSARKPTKPDSRQRAASAETASASLRGAVPVVAEQRGGAREEVRPEHVLQQVQEEPEAVLLAPTRKSQTHGRQEAAALDVAGAVLLLLLLIPVAVHTAGAALLLQQAHRPELVGEQHSHQDGLLLQSLLLPTPLPCSAAACLAGKLARLRQAGKRPCDVDADLLGDGLWHLGLGLSGQATVAARLRRLLPLCCSQRCGA